MMHPFALRFFVCAALVACAPLRPMSKEPGASANAPAEKVVRIPFELTASNHLAIRAILNHAEPVTLMFHTAIESVSLTSAATARLTSVSWDEAIEVQSWGGESKAKYSTSNALQIGALRWEGIAISESENSGEGTDGKFGPNLFAGKVLELDFERKELILREALPEMGPDFVCLPILPNPEGLLVTGQVGVGADTYSNAFLIHSGFGGTLLLDDPFVAAHHLGERLFPLSESELRDSYGNVLKTRKVRLDAFRLGNLTVSEVPIGIFDGALGHQHISVLGGALLKRMRWVFDADRAHVYVAPNRLANAPF